MSVSEILDGVRDRGLDAALEYTRLYDGVDLAPNDAVWNPLLEPAPQIDAAVAQAIDYAFDQIADFHEKTRPVSLISHPQSGLTLEERWTPLPRVGVYVPNGNFPLVSTLLMTAVPARAAGVNEIVAAVPPRGPVRFDPVWIYLFQRLAISEVLMLGGAQAIGAMAYGFSGFSPVDLIAGPGNRYVAEAKREVARRGVAGIDVFAGPSEVMVLANALTAEDFVAADLLAQAEHDADAKSELVTMNPELAERMRHRLDRTAFAAQVAITVVASYAEMVERANRAAPEHLGLMGEDVEDLADQLWSAGAIFVGPLSGQALGDYTAGPSHVLPTGGAGRFQSGLSTRTFFKRVSVIRATNMVDPAVYEHAAVLARLEGLVNHEESMRLRIERQREIV